MPHIDLDQRDYELAKSVAAREGRLLKAVVGRALQGAYGVLPAAQPQQAPADAEGVRDAAQD